MTMAIEDGNLLCGLSTKKFSTPARTNSSYNPLHTFDLPKGSEKHYQQQYADMYFLRLSMLKPVVEQKAEEAWRDFEIAGERARRVDRVLDVRQGELCWVVGTVYMEMALKPNILDDISKEHWIAAPPAREKYISPNGDDKMTLEDESGRLRITGDFLSTTSYVTGCVMAALGTENADGSFEVIATELADLPRQPARWERDESQLALSGKKVKQERPKGGNIAIISGLEISGVSGNTILLDILMEYLLGESAGGVEQAETRKITRLIIAGGSLAHSSPIPSREELAAKKGHKKYGYDSSAYDAAPTEHLDLLLSTLLPQLPITILPGASDPASVSIPQQPLHPALFTQSRSYANPPTQSKDRPGAFDSVTNPWEGDIDGWRLLGTGGQTVADVLKYVEDDNVLDVMEAMLRWRCIAPTAPDTLWCYPFQDDDPLLLKDCPHIYFAGNQPQFDSRVAEGPAGQEVLLVAVPKFRDTGKVVLVDSETLRVECKQFEIPENGGKLS